MMLAEVVRYLQTAGVGTEAGNLFIAKMPDAPDDAICLYEYAGSPPQFAHSGMQWENPGLQVVVRGREYGTARAKINTIFNLLKGLVNFDLGGQEYLRVSPNQSPFPLGIDQNNRYQLAVNFSVSMRAQ